MSLAKILLIGHVGKDAELSQTKTNKSIGKFSIAVNDYSKNEKGENVEKTQWYNVTCWDAMGENAAKLIKKGRQVFVEGKLTVREYTTKDNNIPKYSLDVVATNFHLLGGKEENANTEASTGGAVKSDAPAGGARKSTPKSEPESEMSTAPVTGTDDDLPF